MHNNSNALTHTQEVGTKWYKAPEVDTSNYDHKVDIYSLGIILFELMIPFRTDAVRFKKIEKKFDETLKYQVTKRKKYCVG